MAQTEFLTAFPSGIDIEAMTSEQSRHKHLLNRMLVFNAQAALGRLIGVVNPKALDAQMRLSSRIIGLLINRSYGVGLARYTQDKVLDHRERLEAVNGAP